MWAAASRYYLTEQRVGDLVDGRELLEAADGKHSDVGAERLHPVFVALGVAGELRPQGEGGSPGLAPNQR